MHRFIPAMSTVAGARIAEIVVSHHPRRFGKSKYGLGRVWRVMLDIIAFKFIISVFTSRPKSQKPKSLWQRLSDVLFNPKQRAFRAAAVLSLPFFILGRILFGSANIVMVSCIGLAVALLGLGWLTEHQIQQAKQKLPELGKLARFFIFRCKRRPVRLFGPIGVMLLILGGILLMPQVGSLSSKVLNIAASDMSSISITIGIWVFCFGLFGELIAFANAKRVKDYTVETLLNF